MEDVTIINATACLRDSKGILVTRVYNICTNTITEVPHGSLDLAEMIGLAVAGFAVLCMLILAVLSLFTEEA